MKKLSIYLDTSIINFLFADDAPEKQSITREFFDLYVRLNFYDAFISTVVLDEINRTKDDLKRAILNKVIEDYDLALLEIADKFEEIEQLANAYVENGIIPAKNIDDAFHIAIATVREMDVLLSWNYRHLANVNKEILIQVVNAQFGYRKPLRMVTPLEVFHDEHG